MFPQPWHLEVNQHFVEPTLSAECSHQNLHSLFTAWLCCSSNDGKQQLRTAKRSTKKKKKKNSSAEYWKWRVRNYLVWPLCVLETSGTWNCKCKFKQKTSWKKLTLYLCVNFFKERLWKCLHYKLNITLGPAYIIPATTAFKHHKPVT
jgi:hypothetical protein